jgi:hypothetical protein
VLAALDLAGRVRVALDRPLDAVAEGRDRLVGVTPSG